MATQTINGTAGNDFITAHAASEYSAGQLTFNLAAMPAQGVWPVVNLLINGQVVLANVTIDWDVRTGVIKPISVALPAGDVQSVGIQFTNDLVTTADDRNVYIGSVSINGHDVAIASGTYVMNDFPTSAGRQDMNWNGTMSWSGSVVQQDAASGRVANSDVIDGGDGTDTVSYQGRISNYTIGHNADGSVAVIAKSGAFADTIYHVENVLFDEGGGIAAQVNAAANTIDGGSGLDTLLLAGNHTQYQITHTSVGFSIVGPGVNEYVQNVERLAFADGYVGLDVTGNTGEAYRLYQAAFNRTPDVGGLGFQTNVLDNGTSLSQVASGFIASPEFQQTYGNVTDQAFITLLYQNVLHRAPDQAGLEFHMQEIASGQTRADVLSHFSESPENQANVIGTIQDGMYYTQS